MPRQSIVQFEYPAKKCRTATCPSLFPQLVKIFAHRTTISNVIEQVFFSILHLQQNRYHKGKTKIWLNSLGARCRYCANIFYEHQLLYFRPSFYHLRLQLGAECLWKEDELENPSNFSSIFPSTAIELWTKRLTAAGISTWIELQQLGASGAGKNPLYD